MSRQMGRTADTIVFDEAEEMMRLPLWKRFSLWVWRIRRRKHISIWVSNDKEKKMIEKSTKRIQDQLIAELARKAMNMEEK